MTGSAKKVAGSRGSNKEIGVKQIEDLEKKRTELMKNNNLVHINYGCAH